MAVTGDYDATPRWVKAFALIGAVLALLLVIMVFAGHGPGRHMSSVAPPRGADDTPRNMASPEGGRQ